MGYNGGMVAAVATSKVGTLVKDARRREGLSRRALAELSGVEEDTIKALEQGRIGVPSQDVANRLVANLPTLLMSDLLAAAGYRFDRERSASAAAAEREQWAIDQMRRFLDTLRGRADGAAD